jgi:hypothetical protein
MVQVSSEVESRSQLIGKPVDVRGELKRWKRDEKSLAVGRKGDKVKLKMSH